MFNLYVYLMYTRLDQRISSSWEPVPSQGMQFQAELIEYHQQYQPCQMETPQRHSGSHWIYKKPPWAGWSSWSFNTVPQKNTIWASETFYAGDGELNSSLNSVYTTAARKDSFSSFSGHPGFQLNCTSNLENLWFYENIGYYIAWESENMHGKTMILAASQPLYRGSDLTQL